MVASTEIRNTFLASLMYIHITYCHMNFLYHMFVFIVALCESDFEDMSSSQKLYREFIFGIEKLCERKEKNWWISYKEHKKINVIDFALGKFMQDSHHITLLESYIQAFFQLMHIHMWCLRFIYKSVIQLVMQLNSQCEVWDETFCC